MLSSSVAAIVEGVRVFFSGDRGCVRVFKLLMYLGIRTRSAVLPRGLYCRNLSLLEGPSCLCATAFHKVSVEFPLGCREIFKVG